MSVRFGGRYVIGVDFGTLTARAVVVRVEDGQEVGTAVHAYRHGVIDQRLPASGEPLPPDWALQDPDDYVESMTAAVRGALADSGVDAGEVIGIGTDFTACTMVPTLADGTPLSHLAEYKDRPHAFVKLWKHHAAQPEADRINAVAAGRGEPWLARYGGLISSEWEYAKALELLRRRPRGVPDDGPVGRGRRLDRVAAVRRVRAQCLLGRLQGHPPGRPLPESGVPRRASTRRSSTSSTPSSTSRSAAWATAPARSPPTMAARLGLAEGIAVAVGNVDAHVTAPAARAVGPGQLVAIMGTSTCHVVNGEQLREAPGMCGVVDGGIVDGLWGYEAGQSGVGDLFGWFVDTGVPAAYHDEAARRGVSVHEHLSLLGAAQAVGQHGLLALDWHNGNRSVLVNHELSGLVVGLTVTTRPEDVYRALMEATAFGARTIVETLTASGVPVEEYIVAGGLTKNPVLMQIYADVLRLPLSVIGSEQGPALGSAIHAAVAAGAHPDVPAAADAMGRVAPRRVRAERR